MLPVALFGAVYVPTFILQAIGRWEPELRTQPLAIIDGPPPTYQVVALNHLAEILGVSRGMTKAAVTQFAQVTIRPRCKAREEAAHAALLDVAWSITPRLEDAAPDMLLIDISGLTSLFGDAEAIAREIASRASTFGLDVHVAISANVETARIVARALPGPTIIPQGEERRFLETLPVSMLSPSQGLSDIFERWGVTTCKALASLPVLSLSECVGQEGVRLQAIASGKGMRPLLLAEPAQHFEECFELDEAVDDLEALSFLLGRLLDQLSARLSARALSIAAVQVNFELLPAFEQAFDTSRELQRVKPIARRFSCSLELPVPTRDSKLLLKLLRLRLQSRPPDAPIQKIHMTAQSSLARVTQGSLFVPTAPDPDKLELTIARIAAVVGERNVGSPQLLDSHRPDAFHMQKFSIATADVHASGSTSKRLAKNRSQNSSNYLSPEEAPAIALHVFRPPVPARVRLQGNKPVFASFQGCSGKVIHASGPWRSSGQWWEDQPWQEDAWDLEIIFSGEPPVAHNFSVLDRTLSPCRSEPACAWRRRQAPRNDDPSIFPHSFLYRFYYDGLQEKWFVRGVYD
jgi:protein ImuB